jgi:hypothetical protein
VYSGESSGRGSLAFRQGEVWNCRPRELIAIEEWRRTRTRAGKSRGPVVDAMSITAVDTEETCNITV